MPSDSINIRLNVTEHLGGGNTIKDCAKNFHQLKQLTLCILDSDKHHPKCEIGQTAQEFISEIKSLSSPFIWHYILKAHEIENLIHFKVLCQCNLTTKKFESAHNQTDFADIVNTLFFKYWDCKEGFKPSDLRLVKNEYPSYFARVCALPLVYGVKQEKIDDELAKGFDKRSNLALLSGYKPNALSKCSNYVEANYNDTSLFELDSYQKGDWRNISQLVWPIGCASTPKRI